MRKRADGEVDGIVLAAAGLERLGRSGESGFRFGLRALTPAPGQGALALEARDDAGPAAAAAADLTDREALVELSAERAVVVAGADADRRVAARPEPGDDGVLLIRGFAGLPDGSEHVYDEVRGDPDQPVGLGEALVERMLGAGAGELLERASAGETDG